MAASRCASSMSLQELCCQTVGLNSDKFSKDAFSDLNHPCLNLLLEHLSLMDILRATDFLRDNGINAHIIASHILRTQFKHTDSYPIKATTCPHLLSLFPSDGWDWALSRLLYRRLIVRMVEEFNLTRGSESPQAPSEMWNSIPDKYPDALELFCPPSLSVNKLREKVKRLWKEREKDALIVAAKNILYIIVDLKVCRFLMGPNYEHVLHTFCESLQVLSLLIKNDSDIVEFVKKLKETSTKLERVCIFAIKNDDMNFFDTILSICSGVPQYYITSDGQREREVVETLMLRANPNENQLLKREVLLETTHGEDNTSFFSPSEFDLMDDAVLFGATENTGKFDSDQGMLKVDLKVTNLVNKHLYVSVLAHHLSHWLNLMELHLGVPELHPKVTSVICEIIRRPQFQSFTLSSTDFKADQIEDIFMAVATSRGNNPLEKLMFVSVVTKWDNVEDIDQHDRMPRDNKEMIEHFLQEFTSHRLLELPDFRGTRLLEWYSCTLGLRTECLIRQYIQKDRALQCLCLSNSITRRMLTVTLCAVASSNLHLRDVIIEDHRVLTAEDCKVLVSFLKSVSPTLQSLNLANCLVSRDLYQFEDIVEALTQCRQLKSLDLAMNRLGDVVLPLIPQVARETKLTELSLRKNHVSYQIVLQLLQDLAAMPTQRDKRLDTFDLRGNNFLEGDFQEHCHMCENVARYLLVDPGLAQNKQQQTGPCIPLAYR